MKLTMPKAEIFAPDGRPEAEALARTTHLGVAAHQDDLEIMSYHGILAGFGQRETWYGGVVVTNGAGNPRTGLYAHTTDEEMQDIRRLEQKKAAFVGEYGFQALLDFPSATVKAASEAAVVDDLHQILLAARPQVVYTHNLADRHDTHVAVTLRLIEALRRLPTEERPVQVYGCEVWRDLDWLADEDKIALDVSGHENLASALIALFDVSVAGGKRYDLATLGRRRAHATYHESHGVDETTSLSFAMNLNPLVEDASLSPADYLASLVANFRAEVQDRISRVS